LEVALIGEDDDVLAEDVLVERDRAGFVVVTGGLAVLGDLVLADDAVAGYQRRGREPDDRSGGGEELDSCQLAVKDELARRGCAGVLAAGGKACQHAGGPECRRGRSHHGSFFD
jgi:hypothetical protein